MLGRVDCVLLKPSLLMWLPIVWGHVDAKWWSGQLEGGLSEFPDLAQCWFTEYCLPSYSVFVTVLAPGFPRRTGVCMASRLRLRLLRNWWVPRGECHPTRQRGARISPQSKGARHPGPAGKWHREESRRQGVGDLLGGDRNRVRGRQRAPSQLPGTTGKQIIHLLMWGRGWDVLSTIRFGSPKICGRWGGKKPVLKKTLGIRTDSQCVAQPGRKMQGEARAAEEFSWLCAKKSTHWTCRLGRALWFGP